MKRIKSTKCNKCISSGGGDCATCDPPGTTEQQEPEFIITESELKIIPLEYWVHINRIHSRPAPNINGVIKELEQTIKCNERWGNKLEPYYRGINAAHELTISLLMHPANQTVQQTEENPCTENGCTDTENCDEICQHSRIYSPVQMQQAIAQATEVVLDKLWHRMGAYFDGDPSVDTVYVNVADLATEIESLRLAQPELPISSIDYSAIFKELSSTMDTNPTSLSDHQLNAIETYCRTLGTKARTILHARHPKMPKHSPIER